MGEEENLGVLMEICDANASEDPDVVAMREGVDDEGLVVDQVVETRYCEIKNAIPTQNYLRIVGDDDFTDVEIRIHHKTLEALGWCRAEDERQRSVGIVNQFMSCSDHDQPTHCVACDLRHKAIATIRDELPKRLKSNDDERFRECNEGRAATIANHERYEDRERCHAAMSDGECEWSECPQLRDGEPAKTGRHCPIDTWVDDDY